MAPPNSFLAHWFLRDDITDWPSLDDALAWAAPFGDDTTLAWRACDRADFLVATAGASELPPEPVVRAAIDAAREASAVAKDPAKVRRILHLAGTLKMASITEAVHQAKAMVVPPEVAMKRHETLQQEMLDAENSVFELLSAAAAPMLADGRDSETILRFVRAGLAAWDKTKSLKRHRACLAAVQRHLAEGCAFQAARAAVLAAASLVLHGESSRFSDALQLKADATEKEIRGGNQLASNARRSANTAHFESARAFDLAAHALGHAATATHEAWIEYVMAYLAEALEVQREMARTGKKPPAKGGGLYAQAELRNARTAERLAAYADAVKRAMPGPDASSVIDDGDDLDDDGAIREDLRVHLRNMALVLKDLGDEPAREAAEVALAIVCAPGPLSRKALAPALRTMEERVDAAMERVAATEEDESSRASARHALKKMREEAMTMREITAGVGEKEMS